jgi:hypothetical protein
VPKSLRLASLLAATLLAPAAASAAPPATAMTSKALVLKPLVLTRLDDLDFGSMIPTGSGEWVKINADTGARTFSNASMRIASDEGKRARFASSGLNNQFVVLELSGPSDLTNANGDLLVVSALVLDQNNKVLRRRTATSQTFFVGIGGSLFVRGDQEEGEYVGTYDLTATYM